MKDYYATLGTDVNCTPNEIREAYRKLSKKFHPDLNDNDHYFETRFKEIREAYETLSNPITRSKYDSTLKKGKVYASVEAPAKPRVNIKHRGIDIAFTLTLIVMTCGFGYYVYKSVTGQKVAAVKTAIVSEPAPVIHHKKHHRLKVKIDSTPAPVAEVAKTPVVPPPAGAKTGQTVPVVVKPVVSMPAPFVKPIALSNKVTSDTTPFRQSAPMIATAPKPVSVMPVVNNAPASNNGNVAYLSAIKANATGVVYLRKTDDYHSDVVVSIPNNSKIVVLEKGRTFYKVLFDHKTGYVPNWTVLDR